MPPISPNGEDGTDRPFTARGDLFGAGNLPGDGLSQFLLG